MSEEAFDMQGGEAPAVTPEPVQPEVTQEATPEPAEQSATPPVEAPTAEEGTRSNKRIRELVAERDHYRELADLASSSTSASNNSSVEVPSTEASPDETTQFQQLVRKAVSDEVSDIRQGFKRQAVDREIDLVKTQFPDFDEFLPDVKHVLETNENLRQSANPIRDAYFMAKGMTSAQTISAAKNAGRQEAYKTIAQKGQAGVTPAAPKLVGNPDADLLAKHRAGQLTDAERKANWARIVNAMSAEK